MTNKERLQKELGDQFRVMHWVSKRGTSGPDEVVVERKQDRRYELFYVDDFVASLGDNIKKLAANVTECFAGIETTRQ